MAVHPGPRITSRDHSRLGASFDLRYHTFGFCSLLRHEIPGPLVAQDAAPRLEVQVLHYRSPEALPDPVIERLDKLGFNHICFAVENAEATAKHMRDNGVEVRGELKLFHNRQLFFLTGPEGITIELAQWQ